MFQDDERFHQLKNTELYLSTAIQALTKAENSGGLDHHSVSREKERLNDLLLITEAKIKNIVKQLKE